MVFDIACCGSTHFVLQHMVLGFAHTQHVFRVFLGLAHTQPVNDGMQSLTYVWVLPIPNIVADSEHVRQ